MKKKILKTWTPKNGYTIELLNPNSEEAKRISRDPVMRAQHEKAKAFFKESNLPLEFWEALKTNKSDSK